jgi:ABC-type uncharacterized transport system permease subunit
MLELVGFLMAPRVFLGALVGTIVGIGAAFLVRTLLGPQVAAGVLALLIAAGLVVGVVVGAWGHAEKKPKQL